jgi:hypothetical protein
MQITYATAPWLLRAYMRIRDTINREDAIEVFVF